MRMTKLLVSLAISVALVLVVHSPASAIDINDAPGPRGMITFLEHDSFNGTGQTESRWSYDRKFANDLFNDEASAVVNKSAYFWLLYDDTYYRDRAVCVRPKSFYSLNVAGFNDKMSSAQRMTKRRASSCGSWAVIGVKFD